MITGVLQVDGIAVAYGQRAMPKLVEVLSLPDLSDACSIECLQLLLSLLSSQVTPLSTAPKALIIMHTRSKLLTCQLQVVTASLR